MKWSMCFAILTLSEKIDCDYPYALGLYILLKEAIEDGRFDVLSIDKLLHDIGYMSQSMLRKLSQIGRDKLRDMICDTTRDIKRDNDRDRQRDYRERKRRSPSSPPSPTPLSPLLSPQEKERENAPLSLRDRPPEGVSVAPAKPQKRFKKPTLEELRAYAQEIDYNLNAEAFYDYYEANGWMAGTRRMKDWQATVRNWKRRDEERGIDTRAKHSRPIDDDPLAGCTPEQIAEIERLANDGFHWG